MKLTKQSQWFELESPIGEPSIKWNTNQPYFIERMIQETGVIVWFGEKTNWVKKPNENWTVLTINENAKPIEKYLPNIIYGDDRTYFAPCDMPIYEKLYMEITGKIYLPLILNNKDWVE